MEQDTGVGHRSPATERSVLSRVTMAGRGADTGICALGACTVLAGILRQLYAERHCAAVARRAVRKSRRLPSPGTVGMAGAGILILAGLSMPAVALFL